MGWVSVVTICWVVVVVSDCWNIDQVHVKVVWDESIGMCISCSMMSVSQTSVIVTVSMTIGIFILIIHQMSPV